MGNPEPVFVAAGLMLAAPPLILKGAHVRLRVSAGARQPGFSALGWRWAERISGLSLAEGSRIDLAFRLRENTHPDFGGLELEIVDLRPAR